MKINYDQNFQPDVNRALDAEHKFWSNADPFLKDQLDYFLDRKPENIGYDPTKPKDISKPKEFSEFSTSNEFNPPLKEINDVDSSNVPEANYDAYDYYDGNYYYDSDDYYSEYYNQYYDKDYYEDYNYKVECFKIQGLSFQIIQILDVYRN